PADREFQMGQYTAVDQRVVERGEHLAENRQQQFAEMLVNKDARLVLDFEFGHGLSQCQSNLGRAERIAFIDNFLATAQYRKPTIELPQRLGVVRVGARDDHRYGELVFQLLARYQRQCRRLRRDHFIFIDADQKLAKTVFELRFEHVLHRLCRLIQALDRIEIDALILVAAALFRLLEQTLAQRVLRRAQQIAIKRQGEIPTAGKNVHRSDSFLITGLPV